jgi:hypothetical protein
VRFAFKNDLPFQACEIRVFADKVIELIGVMKMGNLIIRYRRRQVFRFMNRDIDIRVRVRITINEHMALDREGA